MSHIRREPAGQSALRKQLTEAKEGPLEFRRKTEAKKTHLGEGVGAGACCRESALGPPASGFLSGSVRGGSP